MGRNEASDSIPSCMLKLIRDPNVVKMLIDLTISHTNKSDLPIGLGEITQ